MKTRNRIEEVTYSPAVKTRNGHRIIPDDGAPKAENATSKSGFGFFPQRMQEVKSGENEKDEVAPSSPSMSSGRKADSVC